MALASGQDCEFQWFLKHLICGITRRSISANVIRQGIKPFPTTLQTQRSWSHWQITNLDNQNTTTLAVNYLRANRHSDVLRRSLNSTAPLEAAESLTAVPRKCRLMLRLMRLVFADSSAARLCLAGVLVNPCSSDFAFSAHGSVD